MLSANISEKEEQVGKHILRQVRDYLVSELGKYPGITPDQLFSEGDNSIFYMNGKNGTKFDWDVNNHTSVFGIFYKDESPCLCVDVTKSGCIYGYGFIRDPEHPEKEAAQISFGMENAYSKEDALTFAKFLYANADCLDHYDDPVAMIGSEYEQEAERA